MRGYTIFIIAALLLTACADAIKVGVIVDYPEKETYAKCLTVEEGDDGYEILQKTGLSISWSADPLWGHGLCAVEDVGCPKENCWCTEKYWGFYVMHKGERAWTYSPTGFDGGETCSEHYCAKDGDMLGFAYGTYGTTPTQIAYGEVCSEKLPRKKYARGFSVTTEPQNIYAGDDIQIRVLDGYGGHIEEAKFEAYAGTPGASQLITAGEIRNGTARFKLQKEGAYTLRVTAEDYRPSQEYVELTINPKQTTTSSTTSSSTPLTTTSSSTTAPKTTTQPTAISSSTTAPSIASTTTTLWIPAATGMATSAYGYAGVSLLLILAAALYLRRKKD